MPEFSVVTQGLDGRAVLGRPAGDGDRHHLIAQGHRRVQRLAGEPAQVGGGGDDEGVGAGQGLRHPARTRRSPIRTQARCTASKVRTRRDSVRRMSATAIASSSTPVATRFIDWAQTSPPRTRQSGRFRGGAGHVPMARRRGRNPWGGWKGRAGEEKREAVRGAAMRPGRRRGCSVDGRLPIPCSGGDGQRGPHEDGRHHRDEQPTGHLRFRCGTPQHSAADHE